MPQTIDDLNDPDILREYRAGARGQADTAPTFKAYLSRWSALDEPESEFRFHPTRRWCFDLAWPALRVACEIDGGQWVAAGGRHAHNADYEKRRAAQQLGWLVVAFTTQEIARDPLGCVEALEAIIEANRQWVR